MGDSLFQGKVSNQQLDLVSPEQKALFGPLSDFFQGQIGGSFGLEGAENLFQNQFLDPALRGFEQRTLPTLNQQFATTGNTLSSRREKTIADSLTDVQLGAQQQFGQLLPQLLGHQRGILGQAAGFAGQQTQENVVTQGTSIFEQLTAGAAAGAGVAGSLK